jgi:hypothetical protein
MLYVGLQNKSKAERTTPPPCCHKQGREKTGTVVQQGWWRKNAEGQAERGGRPTWRGGCACAWSRLGSAVGSRRWGGGGRRHLHYPWRSACQGPGSRTGKGRDLRRPLWLGRGAVQKHSTTAAALWGGAYAPVAPKLRGAPLVVCSQSCGLPPTPTATMVGGWGSKRKKKKVCALKT